MPLLADEIQVRLRFALAWPAHRPLAHGALNRLCVALGASLGRATVAATADLKIIVPKGERGSLRTLMPRPRGGGEREAENSSLRLRAACGLQLGG